MSKQNNQAKNLEALRQLWREGLDSGAGRFAKMDEMLAEAQRRFSAKDARNNALFDNTRGQPSATP